MAVTVLVQFVKKDLVVHHPMKVFDVFSAAVFLKSGRKRSCVGGTSSSPLSHFQNNKPDCERTCRGKPKLENQ